jgi:hypothetical protein
VTLRPAGAAVEVREGAATAVRAVLAGNRGDALEIAERRFGGPPVAVPCRRRRRPAVPLQIRPQSAKASSDRCR